MYETSSHHAILTAWSTRVAVFVRTVSAVIVPIAEVYRPDASMVAHALELRRTAPRRLGEVRANVANRRVVRAQSRGVAIPARAFGAGRSEEAEVWAVEWRARIVVNCKKWIRYWLEICPEKAMCVSWIHLPLCDELSKALIS
jgi:hypothetical protein